MSIFSTPDELKRIQRILYKYARLPFYEGTVPGAIMEGVLASVRSAEVLSTYDFIDVIQRNSHCGWQVKSTKSTTPVTWKRAKIPNSQQLIQASQNSDEGLQLLGNAIIDFCNQHIKASFNLYGLQEIGYSRLILYPDGQATYFEKILCSITNPNLFKPNDFVWKWSSQKNTRKKEQLCALHGTHKQTSKKCWAWHGLGENQLHFSGEKIWWPDKSDPHAISFCLPSNKLSLEEFLEILDKEELLS
jgi:hypothetical protein